MNFKKELVLSGRGGGGGGGKETVNPDVFSVPTSDPSLDDTNFT